MDRNSRRLSHQKGSKVKLIDRPPSSREGFDGDMMLQTSGVGAILYVKGNGRWFKFYPSAESLDGWHGSQNIVRILPNEFVASDLVSVGKLQLVHPWGYLAFINDEETNAAAVDIAIPVGFKATHVRINILEGGSPGTTDPVITVSKGQLSSTGGSYAVSSSADNTEIAIDAGQIGNDDSFLQVNVTGCFGSSHGTSQHTIRGGYIRIAPVLTPSRVLSGAIDENVLSR